MAGDTLYIMVYIIMATLCADALRMPRFYHVAAAGEKPEKKKGGAKAKAKADTAAAEAEPAAAAAATDDEGLVYIGMRTPQVRRKTQQHACLGSLEQVFDAQR